MVSNISNNLQVKTPERIYYQLAKIKQDCSNLEDSSEEKIKEIISQVNQVFSSLEEVGISHYALGNYRRAAEKYQEVINVIKGKIWKNKKNEDALAISKSLISIQASIDHFCFERLNNHFAFASLTNEQKEILYYLSANLEKSLAHLFGNQIVSDKLDNFGGKLEGLNLCTALMLFKALMEAASKQHSTVFSDAHPEWKKMYGIIEEASAFASLLTSIKSASIEQRLSIHQRMFNRIQQKLNMLSENESLSFPWAWSSPIGPGHLMFISIIKKHPGYLIELYNTGKGLEHHDSLDDGGVDKRITRIVYRVAEDQIAGFNTFLKHIIEPMIYGNIPLNASFPGKHSHPFPYGSNGYSIKELYIYFNQYERLCEDQWESSWWSRGNNSGICSYKVLLSVLHYNAPAFYEPFKIFSQSEVMRLLFKFEELFIAPNETAQMLLSYGISNLARHYNKILDHAVEKTFISIDELEAWSNRLGLIFRPITHSTPLPPLPVELEDLSPLIQEACSSPPPLVDKQDCDVATPPFEFQLPDLSKVPTPLDWYGEKEIDATAYCNYIQELCIYAQTCSKKFLSTGELQFNQPALLVDAFCRECYRLFLDPALVEKGEKLKQQLSLNLELTNLLIDNLLKLLEVKGEISKRIIPHADGFVVAHGIYSVVAELSLLIDAKQSPETSERLDNYSLASPLWKTFKEIRITEMRFYDPTFARDFNWITDHQENLQKAEKALFFNQGFDKVMDKPCFLLKSDSGFYKYIQSKSKISDEMLKIATDRYTHLVEVSLGIPQNNSVIPPFESWVIGWMLNNAKTCLPMHCNQLIHAFWSLNQLVPWINQSNYNPLASFPEPSFSEYYDNSTIKFSLDLKYKFDKPKQHILHYPCGKTREDDRASTHLQSHQIYLENKVAEKIEYSSRAAQTAGETRHPLRILTLLDSYRYNLNKLSALSSYKHHRWIGNVLFSPAGLFTALKQAPQLFKEIDHFFKSAFEFYSVYEDKKDYEFKLVLSFLYGHYVDFLLIDQELSGKDREFMLREAQKSLWDAINLNGLLEHDTYLKAFIGIKKLTGDDVIQLVKGFHAIRNTKIYLKDSMGAIFSVYNHLPAIQKHLQEEKVTNQIVTFLLDTIEVSEKPIESRFQAFPLTEIITENHVKYTFDLLEGKLVHCTLPNYRYDKKNLATHPFYNILYSKSHSYISTDPKTIIEKDNHCEVYPKKYRFYANGDVKKTEKSITYKGALFPEKLQAFSSDLKSAILWMPDDPALEACHLSTNGFSTKNIQKMTREGLLTFKTISGKWKPLAKPTIDHFFFNFDPHAMWAQGTTDNATQTIVLFPSLTFTEDEPLILAHENGTWFLKQNPHLIVAEDQTIQDIDFNGKGLVLENKKTEQRFVMVPRVNKRVLEESYLKDPSKLIFLEIKDNRISIQKNPLENLFAAYLLFANARIPSEFVHAFTYLKAAISLRPYLEAEKKLLSLIFEHAIDQSPSAIAFRLNAYLIREENCSYNTNYRTVSIEIAKCYSEYLSKHHNIPIELRIEENYPRKILKNWLNMSIGLSKTYQIGKQPPLKQIDQLPTQIYDVYERKMLKANKCNSSLSINEPDEEELLSDDSNAEHVLQAFPLIATKPEKDIEHAFDFVLSKIQTANEEELASLEQMLRFNYIGTKWECRYVVVLLLELYNKWTTSPLHPVMKEIKQHIDFLIEGDKKGRRWYSEESQCFYSLISHLEAHFNGINRQQNLKKSYEISLNKKPKTIETKFEFIPIQKLFLEHNNHFSNLFKKPEAIDSNNLTIQKRFQANKSLPKEVQGRIENLNRELAVGEEKNRLYHKVQLLHSLELTKQQLCTTVKDSLTALSKNDAQFIQKEEQHIEQLVNYEIKNNLACRADVVGNLKQELTLADLVVLYLQNDLDKLIAAIGIQDKNDLQSIYQRLGKYLEIYLRKKHTDECLKAISKLKTVDEEMLLTSIQHVGYLLSYESHLINHPNSFIQLALQVACNFIPRPNQKQILDGMFDNGHLKDQFKQIVQADGKTFVLGPYLALLNADGQHLSIHVDPKHQYETTLSTLGGQILKTINKTIYTFEYHDTYEHFQVAYLKKLLIHLKSAIKERKPVAVTQDDLRALRSRYIQSAIELHNLPKGMDYNREFYLKVDFMRSILRCLRLQGIFAPIEEVHEGIDPTKIHNIPAGLPYHFSLDDLYIARRLLVEAANVKDQDNIYLLDLINNNQAKQSPEKREKMLAHLAKWCVNNKKWRTLAGIKKLANNAQLIDYLCQKNAATPDWIQKAIDEHTFTPGERDPIEFILMTRKLLALGWLQTALSKSVYEHFLIVPDYQNRLTTATPCESNMCPAIGSEYSNAFMMALNTLIAGYVQGIPKSQFEEFIKFSCAHAKAESNRGDCLLAETKIFKLFSKLFMQANIEGDLFNFNLKDEEVKAKLLSNLKQQDSEIMSLVGKFICHNVIRNKELFSNEIATNGINVATMAKNVIGYSGTMDNPAARVVMDYTGRVAEICPDEGTDGQTLDILINRDSTVYVMGNTVESLFKDVVEKLPVDKLARLRLIVDGGSHFRGIEPLIVATKMAEIGTQFNIPYKVVLTYDIKTRLPFIVRCEDPRKPLFIKEQRIDSIAKELDVAEEEIAVYLPQFKATGTDLAIKEDAVGIYTVTENTPAYLVIQEVRRLRNLSNTQESICALQEGSLEKMANYLDKPDLVHLKRGLVEDKQLIVDVLQFTYINRFLPLSPENYLLCTQNICNIVTQFLLDGVFQQRFEEKSVFTKAAWLFSENTTYDFIREVGHPRTIVSQKQHLSRFADHILSALQEFDLTMKEFIQITDTIKQTIKHFLPSLPETVEVIDSKQALSQKENNTMVQISNQVRSQNQNAHLNELQQLQQMWKRRSQFTGLARQQHITIESLSDGQFPSPVPFSIGEASKISGLTHFSLDEVMKEIYPNLWQEGTFDPQLIVSGNWFTTYRDQINIGNKHQKPVIYLLLTEREGEYSLALTSHINAKEIAAVYESGFTLPPGKNQWLIRPQGELAWKGPSHYNKKELLMHPKVRNLIVQALVFDGKLEILEQKFWFQALEEWLDTHPNPSMVARYFEQCGLRNKKWEEYLVTKTRKLMKAQLRAK